MDTICGHPMQGRFLVHAILLAFLRCPTLIEQQFSKAGAPVLVQPNKINMAPTPARRGGSPAGNTTERSPGRVNVPLAPARVMFPRPGARARANTVGGTGSSPLANTAGQGQRIGSDSSVPRTPASSRSLAPDAQLGNAPPRPLLLPPSSLNPIPTTHTSRSGLVWQNSRLQLQGYQSPYRQQPSTPRAGPAPPPASPGPRFPGIGQVENGNPISPIPPVSVTAAPGGQAPAATPRRWNFDAEEFIPAAARSPAVHQDSSVSSGSDVIPPVPPGSRASAGPLNSTMIDSTLDSPNQSHESNTPMDIEQPNQNNNNIGNRNRRVQPVAPSTPAGASGRIRKKRSPKRTSPTGGIRRIAGGGIPPAMAEDMKLLCSKAPFKRIVQEILQGQGNQGQPYRMQGQAVEFLQGQAEAYLTTLFSMSGRLAAHSRRKTIQLKDFQLAEYLYAVDRPHHLPMADENEDDGSDNSGARPSPPPYNLRRR